jgi:hypothetical protein
MQRVLILMVLAACGAPRSTPAPRPAAPAPAAVVPAPVDASLAAATDEDAVAHVRTDTDLDDEWIGTYYIGGSPDPACTREAMCWRAARKPPPEPAAPPLATCRSRHSHVPLDATWTQKVRRQGHRDACCYAGDRCKLPMRDDPL